MLLNIFLLAYVLPIVVTMLGAAPFIKRDGGLFRPALMLAAIPLLNIFWALTVLVVGTQMFFDWRKNPSNYHP